MAFDLGSVSAKVTADISQFKQSMISAQEHTKNLGKSIKDAGGKIKAFGTKSTALVSAPLVAAGLGMVKLASDAEETNSKFDAVFKNLSSYANKELTNMAGALGRSETDLKSYAATFQDTLVPLWGDDMRAEAAELSVAAVELAEDLASFNNLRTEDVVRDIQSALVGNTETLRKYGVVASMARIEEHALKEGIIKTGEELDETTKSMAIWSMIMAGTTDAQGDATRTADGFANQMKATRAEFESLAIELGTMIMPLAKELIGHLRSLITWFSGLDENQKKVLLTLAGLAIIIPPIILAIGTFITIIGTAITALSTIGAAIGAVVAFMGSLALAPALIVAAIVGLIAAVGYFVLRWLGLWDEAVAIFNNFTQKAWEFITWLIDGLKSIFQDFYDWIVGGSLIPDLVRDVLAWIGKLRDDFIDYIKRMIFEVIKSFLLFVANIINNVNNLYTTVTSSLGNLWANIKNLFSGGLTYLRGIMDKIKNAIMQPFNEAKEAAEKAVKRIVEKMRDLNPLQRHSPSVVDLVSRGVSALEREYARLGNIGLPTAAGLTGVSGAGVSSGMGINIDLRGATISDEQIARRMATQMGDEIVRRLSMNVRN